MKRTLRLTTLVFCISLILVSWSNAGLAKSVADEPVVEPDFGATAITWNAPQGSGGFVLVVSGPNGYRSEQSFDSTAQPAFEIVDPSGLPLADGLYQYELRPISVGTAQSRSGGDDGRDPAIARQLAGSQTHSSLNIDTVSGVFTIQNGAILDPSAVEEVDASGQPQESASPNEVAAPADNVIPDDQIVQGSLCVGLDCVNNESFGFDTIRLKENNTRIKFEDTSTSSGFPSVDWQLTANDSASGGASKFSIEDITNAKVPFTLIAGAPTNSFYMDSSGRVGLGTSSPVLEMHMTSGDTPAMRLEQNGTSGFTAYTWDVAGNEAGFFVRDLTAGSRLPFRILPGAASASLVIEGSSDVGVGTLSPTASLHVRRSDGTAQLLVEEASETSAARTLMELKNYGKIFLALNDTRSANKVELVGNQGHLIVRLAGTNRLLQSATDGSLTVVGNLVLSGGSCTGCRAAEELWSMSREDVLGQLTKVPVVRWDSVATDPAAAVETADVAHLSPNMQSFYDAYGLGMNGEQIAPLDVATVSLASVQALNEIIQQQQLLIDAQAAQLAAMEARLERVESMAHTHTYLPSVGK